MTLLSSIVTILLFSFAVIGLDEYWHWRRRQKKLREQGNPPKAS